MSYQLADHLDCLEAESIYIFREIYAEFDNPVIMYSVGKDSSVLLRLAQKAFYPNKVPFKLLHVDTRYKMQSMYDFRDEVVQKAGLDLHVHTYSGYKESINPYNLDTQSCCSLLKTTALLEALKEGEYDVAIGGARRDEEKSRSKERILSFRNEFGHWDPRNQRPEVWMNLNPLIHKKESIRAFPLSNWTEIDIWKYIYREGIPISPLYFAKEREVIVKGSGLTLVDNGTQVKDGDHVEMVKCRFRSLGCAPCSGAIRSEADDVPKIIDELFSTKVSERATRVIDHDSSSSMETKKREGYF